MASPGSSHPLGILMAEIHRLASAIRQAVGDDDAAMPALPTQVCDPTAVIRSVCKGLDDFAFLQGADLLRCYRWDKTLLLCDPAHLGAVLAEIISASLKAAGQGGAVIVDSQFGPAGLRLSISDSSGGDGVDAVAWQGSEHHRLLCALTARIEQMGAVQVIGFHRGEGVVVELVFPTAFCLNARMMDRPPSAANQRGRPTKIRERG